jgi:hypothetical protein
MPDDDEGLVSTAAWDKWRSHRASAASSGLISGGGHVLHEAIAEGRVTADGISPRPSRPVPDNIGIMGVMTSEEYQRLTAVKEPSGYETIGESLDVTNQPIGDDSHVPATRGWVRGLLNGGGK